MTAPTQKHVSQVPTKEDDLGAIPLEGSGFEDQHADRLIVDLSGDFSAAGVERDRQLEPEVRQAATSDVTDLRAQFEMAKLVEAGKQQARQAFERFKAEQEAERLQAKPAKQQPDQQENEGEAKHG